jgi:voltage-gated potassium channel
LTQLLDQGAFPPRSARLYRAAITAAVLAAVGASMAGTVPDLSGHHPATTAVEGAAVAVLAADLALRLAAAAKAGGRREVRRYLLTVYGLFDVLAVVPFLLASILALPEDVLTALGIIRIFKLARYSPALETMASVFRREWHSLHSALFIMVLLASLSSTTLYFIERGEGSAFASIPHALWWSVVTLTTLGYGDAVPLTPLGKLAAGFTAVMGLGMFALPASILATGFAQEIKRRDFMATWKLVAKVPTFAALNAEQIAQIAALLRVQWAEPGDAIVREGEVGDCMYFIVSGRAAVEMKPPVMLHAGDFFGEIALIEHTTRTATVRAKTRSQLLVLSAQDFNRMIGANPELRQAIQEKAHERLAALTRNGPAKH